MHEVAAGGPGLKRASTCLPNVLPGIRAHPSHAACPDTFFSSQDLIAKGQVHKGLVPGWEEGSVTDELAAALLFHTMEFADRGVA